MAKPTISMPMSRHGRIHEQEAERAKGVTFGEPHPPTAPKTEKPKAMTLADFEAELKAKYPDDEIQLRGLDNGGYDITVNGRAFPIKRDKIESLTSIAELGAYIDSLKVK